MEDFKEILLNGMSVGEFSAYMVLALIGASISFAFKVRKRFESNNGKPIEWSWRFFLLDNVHKMILTPIVVYVWARFGHDLTGVLPENWYMFGLAFYILIGLFMDHVVTWGIKKVKGFESKV